MAILLKGMILPKGGMIMVAGKEWLTKRGLRYSGSSIRGSARWVTFRQIEAALLALGLNVFIGADSSAMIQGWQWCGGNRRRHIALQKNIDQWGAG
jgi:hypothetical protein